MNLLKLEAMYRGEIDSSFLADGEVPDGYTLNVLRAFIDQKAAEIMERSTWPDSRLEKTS